ncbi:MAG: type II toxin-antitoxin system RelE family toxin [Armatimonadota bacterium]
MSWDVLLSDQAEDDLEQLDGALRVRVEKRLARLAEHPTGPGTKPLAGALTGFRSLRVGRYRACYWIDDNHSAVRVVIVGHRRDVYRRLERRRGW